MFKVRIQIRKQCQPLSENQFGPVIAENYYESNHFYFELDRLQAEKLICLFSAFPTTASTPFPMNTERRSTTFDASARPKTGQEGDGIKLNPLNVSYTHQGDPECGSSYDDPPGLGAKSQMLGTTNDDWEVEKDTHEGRILEPSVGRSYSAVVRNIGGSAANRSQSNIEGGNEEESGGESWSMETHHKEATQNWQLEAVDKTHSHDRPYSSAVPGMGIHHPPKSWSALFKDSATSDVRKETQNINSLVPESRNVSDSGQSDWGWESPCFDTSFNESIRFLEDLVDDSPASQEHMASRINSEIPNSFVLTKETSTFTNDAQNEGRVYTTEAPELNLSYQKIVNTKWNISCIAPHLDYESPPSEATADEDPNDLIDDERIDFLSNGEYAHFLLR